MKRLWFILAISLPTLLLGQINSQFLGEYKDINNRKDYTCRLVFNNDSIYTRHTRIDWDNIVTGGSWTVKKRILYLYPYADKNIWVNKYKIKRRGSSIILKELPKSPLNRFFNPLLSRQIFKKT